MSNATTLQTNNNKLSANNTDLASILNTINNLPEAGGSTSEDLSDELSTQDELLTDQIDQLDILVTALADKAAGGSDPVLQEKTVIPQTSSQNITPDVGYDGLSKVTVEGDANLIPANIKLGVNIFGVMGTLTSSDGGSSGGSSFGWSREVANVAISIVSESEDVLPSIYYTSYYYSDDYEEVYPVHNQVNTLNYTKTIQVMKNTVIYIECQNIMDVVDLTDYTDNVEPAFYKAGGNEYIYDSCEGYMIVMIRGDASLHIEISSNNWGVGGM